MPTRLYRCLALLCVLAVFAAGCDGTTSLAQRLEGDWIGRPETIAERTVRGWPTGPVDEDDPLLVKALADALPTDLEAAADAQVRMRLAESGDAELSLGGASPLNGEWIVTPIDGRRGMLEITPEADEDAVAKRRRFDVEFLPQGTAFVLRDQGADGRFGRLLFERSDTKPETP